MGHWDQIYNMSRSFTRELRGTRNGGIGHGAPDAVSRTPEEPARFVCPVCTEAIPRGETCPRCDALAIDRTGATVTRIYANRSARRTRKREHGASERNLELPRSLVAQSGDELVRLDVRIEEIHAAVHSDAAAGVELRCDVPASRPFLWLADRLAPTRVESCGSFRVSDESGSCELVGAAGVFSSSTKLGCQEARVGDRLVLIGRVTHDGVPYRGDARVFEGDVWVGMKT